MKQEIIKKYQDYKIWCSELGLKSCNANALYIYLNLYDKAKANEVNI